MNRYSYAVFLLLLFNSLHVSAYFQQDVHYTIHVTLNDETHELSASERLVYKNNSQLTLDRIYMHLWPNAYRDENTALAKDLFINGLPRMTGEFENGFIDSLDFHVNGESIKWSLLKDTPDVALLILNKPLGPGDSLIITTPFHVKIPSDKISRMGHLRQRYLISQWYPKPAVFDDNGWNYFSCLNKGEFYSEFGTFDVYITLPENYVLAATGEMNDQKENEWLDKKEQDKEGNIGELKFIPSTATSKTIHFHQDKIHDFAWFTSKYWQPVKHTFIIPGSSKEIIARTFSSGRNPAWENIPAYIENAVNFLSAKIGEYPYSYINAIDADVAAGAGMEYPMVFTIGNDEPLLNDLIVFHEVAHNWFYGILGSNERLHAWMDEGLTTAYEIRYLSEKYNNSATRTFTENVFPDIKLSNAMEVSMVSYLIAARKNSDQPPDQRTERFSMLNYYTSVYAKTGVAFEYLRAWLGDSLFDKSFQIYFNEWKFRHPSPSVLENSLTKTTAKDLRWFFRDFIADKKKIDYSIRRVKKINNTNFEVSVKSKVSLNAPVSVSSMINGKIIETQWKYDLLNNQKFLFSCNDCDAFRIDAEEKIPELRRTNNSIRTNGILKKTERLQFKFATDYKDYYKTQINFSPVIGWNNYNKLMAGAVFHNVTILEKKLEYTFMPIYGFGSKDLAGGGDLRYHFYPDGKKLFRITLRSGLSHYAYAHDSYQNELNNINYSSLLHFTKVDSRIEFDFLPKVNNSKKTVKLTLRDVLIRRDIPFIYGYRPQRLEYNYLQAEYERRDDNYLNAYSQKLNVTFNDDFFKAFVETNKHFSYSNAKKGFDLRFFAAYLNRTKTNTAPDVNYNLSLSGNGPTGLLHGEEDFLFDEIYLGRSETDGIFSKQFIANDAGFKAPTLFYRRSSRWLSSVNASTSLPGILPFRLFADVAVTSDSGLTANGEKTIFSWEAGVSLPLIKDIFIIYLPFLYSSDINYVVDQQKYRTGDLIRFELHIRKLNPLEWIRNISSIASW
jgi:hypothetical protein